MTTSSSEIALSPCHGAELQGVVVWWEVGAGDGATVESEEVLVGACPVCDGAIVLHNPITGEEERVVDPRAPLAQLTLPVRNMSEVSLRDAILSHERSNTQETMRD